MNDIQARENACKNAKTAVDEQQKKLSKAIMSTRESQNAYLQGVIRVATLSEKTRRKKYFLFNLVTYGGSVLLSLILLLINVCIGILFVAAVVFTIWIVKFKTGDANKANYDRRKTFFLKYAYAIPADEHIKWKNGSISYTANTNNSADGWKCPKCSVLNINAANFCVRCGTQKS